MLTGARLDVGPRADARSRLLGELAAAPARKGYGIAYDLLGNRAEAEEAVQEALARACESIADLRDPAAAPAWFLRIVTTMCLRTLRRRRLRRRLFGWWPGKDGEADPAPVSADTGTDDIAERMHATGAASASPPEPGSQPNSRRRSRRLRSVRRHIVVTMRRNHDGAAAGSRRSAIDSQARARASCTASSASARLPSRS